MVDIKTVKNGLELIIGENPTNVNTGSEEFCVVYMTIVVVVNVLDYVAKFTLRDF